MGSSDGSTTMLDDFGNTWTASGNAQIDTAQSQWGGASGLFDGTGDSVVTPSSSNYGMGAGDYIVEGLVRQATQGSALRCMFDNRAGGAGIGIYSSTTTANATDRLILTNNVAIIAGTSTTQIAANTWTHWLVSRVGTTVRGFLNGVQVWSVTDSRTLAATTTCLIGDVNGGGQGFNGHLDDVRVTIGLGISADFTPPTAAFPNS